MLITLPSSKKNMLSLFTPTKPPQKVQFKNIPVDRPVAKLALAISAAVLPPNLTILFVSSDWAFVCTSNSWSMLWEWWPSSLSWLSWQFCVVFGYLPKMALMLDKITTLFCFQQLWVFFLPSIPSAPIQK